MGVLKRQNHERKQAGAADFLTCVAVVKEQCPRAAYPLSCRLPAHCTGSKVSVGVICGTVGNRTLIAPHYTSVTSTSKGIACSRSEPRLMNPIAMRAMTIAVAKEKAKMMPIGENPMP